MSSAAGSARASGAPCPAQWAPKRRSPSARAAAASALPAAVRQWVVRRSRFVDGPRELGEPVGQAARRPSRDDARPRRCGPPPGAEQASAISRVGAGFGATDERGPELRARRPERETGGDPRPVHDAARGDHRHAAARRQQAREREGAQPIVGRAGVHDAAGGLRPRSPGRRSPRSPPPRAPAPLRRSWRRRAARYRPRAAPRSRGATERRSGSSRPAAGPRAAGPASLRRRGRCDRPRSGDPAAGHRTIETSVPARPASAARDRDPAPGAGDRRGSH